MIRRLDRRHKEDRAKSILLEADSVGRGVILEKGHRAPVLEQNKFAAMLLEEIGELTVERGLFLFQIHSASKRGTEVYAPFHPKCNSNAARAGRAAIECVALEPPIGRLLCRISGRETDVDGTILLELVGD